MRYPYKTYDIEIDDLPGADGTYLGIIVLGTHTKHVKFLKSIDDLKDYLEGKINEWIDKKAAAA